MAAPSTPPQFLTRFREHALLRGDAPAMTFVDFEADAAGRETTWTYAQADLRAREIAAALRDRCAPGDPVALLGPQSLGYLAAFLGCLYAGVRAVPLYPPHSLRPNGRLGALLAAARPVCVITEPRQSADVAEFVRALGLDPVPPVLDATTLGAGRGAEWTPPDTGDSTVAYLQYTSGSTSHPRGVRVTHGNLAHTAAHCARAFDLDPATAVSVTWLPFFHDFGLASSVTIPLTLGGRVVAFDPLAFVLRPMRWPELITRHRGTFVPGPDFSLRMCSDAATQAPAEELAGLDLSSVTALVNGSEPVREESLRAFTAAFAPHGFSPAAHAPAYGLAEATIMVTATPTGTEPRVFACDRRELAKGQAVPAADPRSAAARVVVGCGPTWGERCAIVDPDTRVGLPDRHVGEIWVDGPVVADGYEHHPGLSADVFGARRADAPDAAWLRTGDLGFLDDGCLYVVGRLKDLVIVDGRNHHPVDIEATVEAAAGGMLRRGHVAAVPVDTGGRERLIVIAERATGPAFDRDTSLRLRTRVRGALAEQHGIALHDLVLVRRGALPKTSSGKLQRSLARDRYRAGEYG
jgi:acyl-CoA synthetase (AMP-forming)/AMP-acid ligase II